MLPLAVIGWVINPADDVGGADNRGGIGIEAGLGLELLFHASHAAW